MTKPLPPHGTTARAKRCDCPPCRAARSRYNKHRRYLNATGRPARIDAGAATQHVRELLAAGTPWGHIMTTAAVSSWTLHSLLHGQQVISWRVAERIQAVDFAPSPRQLVEATGSIRRIRALAALGHRSKDLVAISGVEHATVSDLLNGYLTVVRLDTHRRIASAYDALSMTVPEPSLGAVRAVNRATREGWPPPLAWDNIDDPDETPTGWQRADRPRRAADLVEDAAFIIRTTGASLDDAAARLGTSRNNLEQARKRTADRQRTAA